MDKNLTALSRAFLIVFSLPLFCFSQTENTTQKTFYRNNQLKSIGILHGRDTVEIRKYYRNGQLEDSLWLYFSESREEIVFGTEKSFYKSGQLESVIHHGRTANEYTQYEYYKNGKLARTAQSPLGPAKSYNKKGKQIKHYEAFTPKQYKSGQHLLGTSFNTRITSNKAVLTNGRKTKTIKSGARISMYVKGDNKQIDFCKVEGFSKDSLYISKFEYDAIHGREKGSYMRYTNTIALGINQLDSIYYSKHNTRRRNITSAVLGLAGGTVFLVSAIYLPTAIKGVYDGDIETKQVASFYAVATAIGAPLLISGNLINRTMIPKTYNMRHWTIIVKK
ncbi:MAG: hypothetical protein KF900_13755 [Bacteroidetes bacterium]|nr:hypothetical protein [Bacteroidota bacterium]